MACLLVFNVQQALRLINMPGLLVLLVFLESILDLQVSLFVPIVMVVM
jgi:hypothetical protein